MAGGKTKHNDIEGVHWFLFVASVKDLRISLPGTHGYAMAWDPPPFSAQVFSNLADKFKDIVVNLAVEAVFAEVSSRRSSSSTGSLRRKWTTMSTANRYFARFSDWVPPR